MKKILVLGATSGIAIPCLRIWATQGAAFFLCARNKDKLQAVYDDLIARGAGPSHMHTCDLSDTSSHQKLFDALSVDFSDYDGVFLAYGTLGDQSECEKDYQKALELYQSNFLSAVSLLTTIANDFEVRKQGKIAVITSVAGDRGRKMNYIYGSAKGALNLYLQGLRNRLSNAGVDVITIKPGFVATPMTEHLKKGLLFAEPDNIAPTIVSAIDKGKEIVYVPWFWRLIMTIICSIPERVFKRLSI